MEIEKSLKLAIIGGGNMGTAIANGLLHELWQPENLHFVEPGTPRCNWLRSHYAQCHAIESLQQLTPCDIYLLAVKPDQMAKACRQLVEHQHVRDGVLFISIAAGVSTTSIQSWLGFDCIIRCMPNTPACERLGATGIYCHRGIPAPYRQLAEDIMGTIGITVSVENEAQLNAVTAISGSGPAYFYYFMECLYQSALSLGLSANDSMLLVKQTALGASHLASQSSLSLETLRQQVTSKGGTTEKAIQSLQTGKLDAIVQTAVHAAALRAEEISQEIR